MQQNYVFHKLHIQGFDDLNYNEDCIMCRQTCFVSYKYAYVVGGYREHNTISIVMLELYYFIVR